MTAIYKILAELEGFRDESANKRTELLARARSRQDRYKMLSLVSGILGLFSTLAATAIFSQLLNSTIIKVFTALIMLVSGTIGLIVAIFNDPKENTILFTGAGDFLLLRDRISADLLKTNPTEKQAISLIKKYGEAYGQLSAKYDHYLGRRNSHALMEARERGRRIDDAVRELEQEMP